MRWNYIHLIVVCLPCSRVTKSVILFSRVPYGHLTIQVERKRVWKLQRMVEGCLKKKTFTNACVLFTCKITLIIIHPFIIHRFFQWVFANFCYRFQPFFAHRYFHREFQMALLKKFSQTLFIGFFTGFFRGVCWAILWKFVHRFFHRVFHRLILVTGFFTGSQILKFSQNFGCAKFTGFFTGCFLVTGYFTYFSQHFHRFSSNSVVSGAVQWKLKQLWKTLPRELH